MQPSDPVSSPPRPPLVELHLHLEGALTAPRAFSLARGLSRVEAPPGGGIRAAAGNPIDLDAEPALWADARWSFDDLPGFLRLFGWATRLLTTPRAYGDVLADLLDALEEDGVVHAEVFVAIGQMLHAGIDPAPILPHLAAVAEDRASRGGPDVRFIADATRQWGVRACERTLDRALDLQAHRIVGFGMGGDEDGPRAREFKRIFRRARSAGLGLTCHAGEGTRADAVREVVEELGVTRVGHGVAAATEATLMRELTQERVLLEVCPTSNLRTGVWRPERGPHPLMTLLQHEVPVALGSDDPAFFDTSLAREWDRVEGWGCTTATLEALNRAAVAWTFVSGYDRAALRGKIPPSSAGESAPRRGG